MKKRWQFDRPDLHWAALIGLVAVLVYLPVLWTGFSGDDFFILLRLQQMHGLAHPLAYFTQEFFGYYRPLAFLSHAIDWQVWGMHAAGFHLTSLWLHAANAILVFILARRLTTRLAAVVAALLFAVHPAGEEAVYWIAARFDLLATALTLVSLLLLMDDRRGLRWLGMGAFGLALLSKESALALPMMTTAYDVVVGRLDWRATLKRLAPLLLVMAAYAVLRSAAADLAVASDAHRLPKLFAMAAFLAGLLSLSRVYGQRPPGLKGLASFRTVEWVGALGFVVLIAVALAVPVTSAFVREKLGFIAFAAFYLVSPVVLPPVTMRFFTPDVAIGALPGLILLVAIAAIVWRARRWLLAHTSTSFAASITVAALVPVLSLTGSMRYVYLSTVGASLLAGLGVQGLAGRGRTRAFAMLAVFMVISVEQLAMAASAWRWGSSMTRDGLALMSRDLAPCGTKDILMLTAPAGIRGVYCNFYWDAFPATTGCAPASLTALLRVVNEDAHVDVATTDGAIELRVPNYRGTFVASADLRNFDRPVFESSRMAFDTSMGHVETWNESGTQRFTLTLAEKARTAQLFYYSDGAMRPMK